MKQRDACDGELDDDVFPALADFLDLTCEELQQVLASEHSA